MNETNEQATAWVDEAHSIPQAACDLAQAEIGSIRATMDAEGNVRMEATLAPEDRRVLREVAQDQARSHADRIGSPVGLRGLFPSNLVRYRAARRKP